jgi:hypothetical protein
MTVETVLNRTDFVPRTATAVFVRDRVAVEDVASAPRFLEGCDCPAELMAATQTMNAPNDLVLPDDAVRSHPSKDVLQFLAAE